MSLTANIVLALQKKFPGINFLNEVIIQDDGDGRGPYIKYWRRPELMPTDQELSEVDISTPIENKPTSDEQLKMIYKDMKNNTRTFIETMAKYYE